METPASVDQIINELQCLLDASEIPRDEENLNNNSIPSPSTFQCITRMCFGSIATQAEFSETQACTLVTTILAKHLQLSGDLMWLREIGVLFFESAFQALTALISGTNAKSNLASLAKCHEAETAKIVLSCLQLCFKLHVQQQVGNFLPPIVQPNISLTDSAQVDVFPLMEHCIRALENLILHAGIRRTFCRELGGCEVLVRCLSEIGPLKASIAEHSLAALGNLVDASDSTENENESESENNNERKASELPVVEPAIESNDGAEIALEIDAQLPLEPPTTSLAEPVTPLSQPRAVRNSVTRMVQVGVCEATLAALHRFGGEEVSIADCALALVQALAVRDAEALRRFEVYQCTTKSTLTPSKSMFGSSMKIIGLTSASMSSANLHSDTQTITDTHADLNGTMAVLAKVLRAHYESSVTVAESGIGAVGSLILQSSVLLLHLLSNGGLGLVMCVLDKWGIVSTSISAKAARILTEIVGTVRMCRKELHRVNSYYEPKHANSSTSHSRSRAENSRHAPTGSRATLPTLTSPSNDEYSVTESVTETDVFDAMFDEDDATVLEIDVGVAGATPAYVYKVLDRVDTRLLLMDAENGVLDKELSKHEGAVARRRVGMKAVGSVKMKSSATVETLPRLPSSAQSLSQLNSVLSRAASVRKPSFALGSEVSLLHLITEATKQEPFGPVFGAALTMLQQHGEYCLEVLHPALQLLLTVCDFGAYPYHWAQVSASDGCDILVKALHNPDILLPQSPEEAADINTVFTAEMGLQVLQQLALCNTESKEKLCKLNAHIIVVDMLHAHGAKSIFAANLGVHVVVLLYDTVSALEANEGNSRACSTIMHLMVHYEGLNLIFAEMGMCMLKTLTQYKPNQRLLGDHKACAVIVRLLRVYTQTERSELSDRIAIHGLATIAHLAGFEPNRSRLAKCGACKLVVELTHEYGANSEGAAAEGLGAISVLAGTNRGMLGELGVCVVVVALIAQYMTAAATEYNDGVACLASLAMHNLCLDYEENRQRFRQLNVVPAMKALLTERMVSQRTREALRDAVNIIRF